MEIEMTEKISGKKYLRGSYTVEAAVVMSLTVFVLASLILCTFYIHDRAVLQCMVCETAAAGSGFATDAERKEAAKTAAARIRAARFLGSRRLDGNAATGENEVTVVWNAEYPVPGFAAPYLSGNTIKVSKSWTSRILDPADTIRKIKGAGELLTGGDK